MNTVLSQRRKERLAEAARARELTEAAQIPVVALSLCEWNKERRRLMLASEYCGMPRQLFVRSERSGREVRFVAIGPEDVLYCHDNWDGEQCIYRPTDPNTRVDYLVITHQC